MADTTRAKQTKPDAPAPVQGQERRPPERYWELVRAAGKLFEEKGYQGASVRDIAHAVGMTSGSFFYHFATKEDVLFAVLEGGMKEGLQVVERKLEAARTPRERLHALIAGHLEALHSQYSYAHKVWLREWRQISPEKRVPLEALSQSSKYVAGGSRASQEGRLDRGRCFVIPQERGGRAQLDDSLGP